KRRFVSGASGADPLMQARMLLRSYLPAATPGWLLIALYSAGTPMKIVGLKRSMQPSTSSMSRALGTMIIADAIETANVITATIPYTWNSGMAARNRSSPLWSPASQQRIWMALLTSALCGLRAALGMPVVPPVNWKIAVSSFGLMSTF